MDKIRHVQLPKDQDSAHLININIFFKGYANQRQVVRLEERELAGGTQRWPETASALIV